jgi:hypothetical protein
MTPMVVLLVNRLLPSRYGHLSTWRWTMATRTSRRLPSLEVAVARIVSNETERE